MNLNCLIVTLCKSPNYGAYLQAFALKEVLSGYGYNVSFLDIYDKENNKKRYNFLFRGWKRQPLSLLFNLRKLIALAKSEREFDLVQRGDLSKYRVAFIGADEIWSVTNGTFNSAPEFFGLDLGGMLKFSYAPSVGNSGVEDMLNHPVFMEGVNKLDRISVRDGESFEVATRCANRSDVNLVLDPTFLHDFAFDEKALKINRRFLLVYTYGFTKEVVNEVKAYARRNDLIIISAGIYHSWADRNIPCNPFEFLSIIKQAEYVVTDTFHGSIFAIKYRKNFICYGRHKKKVKYLLESLGLSESLCDEGYLTAGKSIKTDYSHFVIKVQPLIDRSREYLENCNKLVE